MNRNRLLAVFVLSIIVVIISFFWTKNIEKTNLTDTVRAQAPGQFVELSEGKTHYLLEGSPDGIPLLLIHGVTVPSFIWDEIATKLVSEGFYVLRYDLFGRGFSDRPDQNYSRQFFSQQAAQLADQLFEGRPYHVAGLSLGAAIAADLTVNHPSQVKRLVLISPFTVGFDITPMQVPILSSYLATAVLIPKLLPGLKNLFSDPAMLPEEWYERYTDQLTLKGFRRAFISTLVHFSSQDQLDLYAQLGEQESPLMLAWGTEDQRTPYELHPWVLKELPHALFYTYEGAGHLLHIEQESLFLDHLIPFLKDEKEYFEPLLEEEESAL